MPDYKRSLRRVLKKVNRKRPHQLAMVRRWKYIQMEDRFIERQLGLSQYNVREHNQELPRISKGERIERYFSASDTSSSRNASTNNKATNLDGFWDLPVENCPEYTNSFGKVDDDNEDAWTDMECWDADDDDKVAEDENNNDVKTKCAVNDHDENDDNEDKDDNDDSDDNEDNDDDYDLVMACGPKVLGAQEECPHYLEMSCGWKLRFKRDFDEGSFETDFDKL